MINKLRIKIAVFIAFLFLSVFIPGRFSLAADFDMSWPSEAVYDTVGGGENDLARGVVADDTGVYSVGEVAEPGCCDTGTRWRIEKRNLSDGSLSAPAWEETYDPGGINYLDGAYAVAIDDLYIYVVGFQSEFRNSKWRIEKRSIIDGSLIDSENSDPSNFLIESIVTFEHPTGIAIDESYMYIIGIDFSLGSINSRWRIEKRNLSDLQLVGSAVTVNPTSNKDLPTGIAIDDSYMYVIGSDEVMYTRDTRWRIEKRNLSDLQLVGSAVTFPANNNLNDEPYGIDEYNGNIYIAGYQATTLTNTKWLIQSRKASDIASLNWSATNDVTTKDDQAYSISVDSTGVYIAGYEGFDCCGLPGKWRFEKRNLLNGNLEDSETEGELSSLTGSNNIPYGVFVNGDALYAAGTQNFADCSADAKWRIEKRGKTSPIIPRIEMLPSDFSLGTARDLEVWIRDAVPAGQEINFEKLGANPEKFYLNNLSCIVDGTGYCKTTVSAVDWDDSYTATIAAKYDAGGYEPAYSSGTIVKIPQCNISCPPSVDLYSSETSEYSVPVTGNDPSCALLSCSKLEGSSDIEVEMIDGDSCLVRALNNARYGTAVARSQSSDSKVCDTEIHLLPKGWIEMSPSD